MLVSVACKKCKAEYTLDTQKDLDWILYFIENPELGESEQERTYKARWTCFCENCENDLLVTFYVDADSHGEQKFDGYTEEGCTVLTENVQCYCPRASLDETDLDMAQFMGLL